MNKNKTILQVPIDKKIRDAALIAANDLGFSSLQEGVRLFVFQLAQKRTRISISVEPQTVKLSDKANKRYSKMIDEIESGKVKTKAFHSVDELMKDLLKN